MEEEEGRKGRWRGGGRKEPVAVKSGRAGAGGGGGVDVGDVEPGGICFSEDGGEVLQRGGRQRPLQVVQEDHLSLEPGRCDEKHGEESHGELDVEEVGAEQPGEGRSGRGLGHDGLRRIELLI